MTYSYYPGCTLKTKGRALDVSGRLCAEALGVHMEEIENWQCCGAVYPQASDEIATRLSSVRALDAARQKGQPLLTLCSACHHVIKRVNHDMQTNADLRFKANNYLQLDTPYAGETQVVHYLEMLRDAVGFDRIRQAVKHPLTGMKIGAYYGCLLLRPSGVMAFDDPENPTIIEDFIAALGAQPVYYGLRNECCGGYMTVEDGDFAAHQARKIVDGARAAGAQCLITACPLCQYNLSKNSAELPVRYFTELLAQALGIEEAVQ